VSDHNNGQALAQVYFEGQPSSGEPAHPRRAEPDGGELRQAAGDAEAIETGRLGAVLRASFNREDATHRAR